MNRCDDDDTNNYSGGGANSRDNGSVSNYNDGLETAQTTIKESQRQAHKHDRGGTNNCNRGKQYAIKAESGEDK